MKHPTDKDPTIKKLSSEDIKSQLIAEELLAIIKKHKLPYYKAIEALEDTERLINSCRIM